MKAVRKAVSVFTTIALCASLSACGGASSTGSETPVATVSDSSVVNIAVTDTLGTLNPLAMDWTFINVYAAGLEFLPLGTFGSDYSINYMLASDISTEDNQTFNVTLRDDAKWSDGEPITTDDVIFTILAMTSPEVANFSFDFSPFVGFNDDGTSPSGATSVEGLKKIDDTHMQFICKDHMSLATFMNNIVTWILIVPEHVLKDVDRSELLGLDFFNHPDVVSGPYMVTEYDSAHYISYKRNENYFLGTPSIENLNIKIVQGSEILTGLRAGEIDFTLPSSTNIPVEDRETIEALSGVTTTWTSPITDEITFFNTSKVVDARVRKAIVMAIDRQQLVDTVLSGKGEVIDGFIPSSSPYYDDSKDTIPYDPEQAKTLLEEAGWDSSVTLEYYVPSNDTNIVRAAQIIQQQLAAVGVNININKVDFATLMTIAGSADVDLFSVQYTITPNDYYADEYYLVNIPEVSWTGGYYNETVNEALVSTQIDPDFEKQKEYFNAVETAMIEDVPMFSTFFLSNLGAASDRLENAVPSVYGALANVHEWKIK